MIIIPEKIEGLTVKEVGLGLYGKTITHIVYPDTVEKYDDCGSIGCSLKNCVTLEYVKFSAGCKDVKFGELPYLKECTALKTVILPEGIVSLPALEGCTALESVTLPSSLQVINMSVFADCKSLKELVIPEGASFSIDNYRTFAGTNLPLATQAKLKELGYTGDF